jgi:hypothetical protein
VLATLVDGVTERAVVVARSGNLDQRAHGRTRRDRMLWATRQWELTHRHGKRGGAETIDGLNGMSDRVSTADSGC